MSAACSNGSLVTLALLASRHMIWSYTAVIGGRSLTAGAVHIRALNRVKALSLGGLLFAVSLSGCYRSPSEESREVTGTVTYRERIALPQEAELLVSLVDTQNSNGARPVIAEFSRLDPGSPPFDYRLPYLDQSINPDHQYGVSAQISAAGETLFYTVAPTPVITGGHPTSADVVMVRGNSRPALTE